MDGSTLQLAMAADSTVLDLQKAIHEATQGRLAAAPSEQDVVLLAGGGVKMRAAQKLADYNIGEEGSVTMVVRGKEAVQNDSASKIGGFFRKRQEKQAAAQDAAAAKIGS